MTQSTKGAASPEQLKTIREAADFLQVCTKTLREFIAREELAAHRVGRQWRLKQSDIEKFLRERQN